MLSGSVWTNSPCISVQLIEVGVDLANDLLLAFLHRSGLRDRGSGSGGGSGCCGFACHAAPAPMGLLTGFWAGTAGAAAAGAGAVTAAGGLDGLVFVTSVSPPSANASGAWHTPIKTPMAHCQSNL